MTRALFICSRNRLRSPTAEEVFASWPGIETDSAGLAPDAVTIVSADQVAWAEIIFVMERAHKVKLSKKFGTHLKDKRIVCLDIPDRYAFMQPELIALLEQKAGRFLRS
ncbi:low molecular weight protein tyrosine phosphatase family protein [Paraburkholderia sp.]|uniref:low molecular weight protein tyrosine phosphatase family protein n=1 Tax=Paraburkholderia sp. TaxID=1926495 RepID=UPI003D6E999E